MSCFTVLGASGYIGSRLVVRLQADGHEVWAPERGDSELLERPLGHVIYCVGLTGNFRSRPFDTVQAHVGLLAELLQHAKFDSLLYLSSTRVYQGAERTDENAALTVLPGVPSYLYNLTKLTGESLCRCSGREGVRVARLSNVVGAGMNPASGNLIAMLLQDSRTGHVVLQSAPESEKDYIHIEDVLDLLPRIAVEGQSSTYNVASGNQTSHAQWLQWLAASTRCSHTVQPGAPLQTFASVDVSRLKTEFGFVARPIFDWMTTSPQVQIKYQG